MKHHTTKKFRGMLADLSLDLRRKADAAYEKMRENPSHPGLEFKKVGKVWSARVDDAYRVLGYERAPGHMTWF